MLALLTCPAGLLAPPLLNSIFSLLLKSAMQMFPFANGGKDISLLAMVGAGIRGYL